MQDTDLDGAVLEIGKITRDRVHQPLRAADQVLGGGVLWILGDIVGLPFLAAQLIQMIREDEAEATVVDAELDARDAVALPGGQAGSQQPWWESDPRFADRFGPAGQPPASGP